MTESEWLASEDPQAMLKLIIGNKANVAEGLGGPNIVSDRKLRLWCYSCRALSGRGLEASLYQKIDKTDGADGGNALSNVLSWANPDLDEEDDPKPPVKANLLRDIVGNPFRPVTLPCSCHCGPRKSWPVSGECPECGSGGWCPWLTPTVLSLAQAAYEERQPDGTLDPLRLMVLADPLEEAGCPVEIECRCENAVIIHPKGAGGQMIIRRCPDCHGTYKRHHPILAHLRSPGPHVRGCWALDIVLGKE